jgi:hypothetical protein
MLPIPACDNATIQSGAAREEDILYRVLLLQNLGPALGGEELMADGYVVGSRTRAPMPATRQ